jgi:hypothetical protein
MSCNVVLHDCTRHNPFAIGDGGWLAPMATELVDRLAILVVVRRFPGMGANDSRSLRYDSYATLCLWKYLCSSSVFLGGCATRIHATSFCWSSW